MKGKLNLTPKQAVGLWGVAATIIGGIGTYYCSKLFFDGLFVLRNYKNIKAIKIK